MIVSIYGTFKNEKEMQAHIQKIQDLRASGQWNEWLLMMPGRSFVVWKGKRVHATNGVHRDEHVTVVWGKGTMGTHFVVHQSVNGHCRTIDDARVSAKFVQQMIRRRERDGYEFTVDMTSTPPDVMKKLDWLDPAVLAIRDTTYGYDVEFKDRYIADPRICHNGRCQEPGVQRVDSDDRPWYWYTLCEDHRTDTLDPREPSVTLQTTVRKRGKIVYVQHRVRQNEHGGTPGPTLCGLDRFGKDAPIKGFNVRGGVSGPNVNEEICEACVQGDLDLRKSAEFLERRLRWLERERQKDALAWAGEKAALLEAQSRAVSEASQRLTRLQELLTASTADAEQIEAQLRDLDNLRREVQDGKTLACKFLDSYDRITARLEEYDAEFISRFIGYREATFEPVIAKAKEIIRETD